MLGTSPPEPERDDAWDENEVGARCQAKALWEAQFGNPSQSQQRAESALGLSAGRDAQYRAALALAVASDTARAKTLADDLDKQMPEDAQVQSNFLPIVNAKLVLSRKDAAEALEILLRAAPTNWAISTRFISIPSMYAARLI